MDDNKFDDIIKGKVGEYEDSNFDPSALAAFHNRMATDAGWPWHVRYRSELAAATAAVVVILFTFFGQQYSSKQTTEGLRDELLALTTQNEKMSQLITEMKNSKSTPNAPDTIRIVKFQESNPFRYTRLLKEIDALKNSLTDSFRAASNISENGNHLTPADNRQAFTGFFENQFSQFKMGEFSLAEEDSSKQEIEPIDPETKKLTAKEIKKKENYRKGVGFRLGPTAEISHGLYRPGVGEIDMGYGILGDIILSPSLSFETGLKFAHRFYSVSENNLSKINLPFVNQVIGEIKLAEIDSWILEVPMNMKYSLPLSPKTSALFRLGYSPVVYTAQTLEYSYEFDVTQNVYLKDSHKNKDVHLYAGAANVSIGTSKQLKNKKVLELGIFYQQGLGNMGLEKAKSSYLGLRTVYWFPLR